jgi:hypothetical protein
MVGTVEDIKALAVLMRIAIQLSLRPPVDRGLSASLELVPRTT